MQRCREHCGLGAAGGTDRADGSVWPWRSSVGCRVAMSCFLKITPFLQDFVWLCVLMINCCQNTKADKFFLFFYAELSRSSTCLASSLFPLNKSRVYINPNFKLLCYCFLPPPELFDNRWWFNSIHWKTKGGRRSKMRHCTSTPAFS